MLDFEIALIQNRKVLVIYTCFSFANVEQSQFRLFEKIGTLELWQILVHPCFSI